MSLPDKITYSTWDENIRVIAEDPYQYSATRCLQGTDEAGNKSEMVRQEYTYPGGYMTLTEKPPCGEPDPDNSPGKDNPDDNESAASFPTDNLIPVDLNSDNLILYSGWADATIKLLQSLNFSFNFRDPTGDLAILYAV